MFPLYCCVQITWVNADSHFVWVYYSDHAKIYELDFYITKINASTILGAQACTQLKILQRMNNICEAQCESSAKPSQSPDILDEFPDVFTGLGCLPGKHTIRINPTVTPAVHPPRRVPLAVKDKVKDEMVGDRIVIRCRSSKVRETYLGRFRPVLR